MARAAYRYALWACSALALCFFLPGARPYSALAAPYNTPAEARAAELGEIAASAELCELDGLGLVARQSGVQLSAQTWTSGTPQALMAGLSAFQAGYHAFEQSYSAASELSKSRSCAFAWLRWRAIRAASPMAAGIAASPAPGSELLAADTGRLHGSIWACRATSGWPASIDVQIVEQASEALLFAALDSKAPSELLDAQLAWTQSFVHAGKAAMTPGNCKDMRGALDELDDSFGRLSAIFPALARALAARNKLLGAPA